MMGKLLAIVLLTAIYLFSLASFATGDIAIGAILATGAMWLFRNFLFGDSEGIQQRTAPSLLSRIVWFPVFCTVTAWEIIKGTWQVTKVVLGFAPLHQPGIVRVPIGERTRLGVVVSSIATTLAPGTFLVDIDWVNRDMLIHALDAADPDAVRAAHQLFYDRYQRKVFP